MPTAHLIFFTEPRELTDAEYAEAESLGHLRDPDDPPSAGRVWPPAQMTQQGIAVTPAADSTDDTTGEAKAGAKSKTKES